MRIGIVNDMPMAVEALRRALALRPGFDVAWTAGNGADAVAACARDTPDLVLMDLTMPVMDGVEATRRIMAATPCAILVVTVSVGAQVGRVFEAMGAGALDAVDTPSLGVGDPAVSAQPLLAKIDTIGKLIGDKGRAGRAATAPRAPDGAQRSLVAIGASAGGPGALAEVLKALGKNFAPAVVIIQHVDAQFAPGMAQWLNDQCALPVRVAVGGETPLPGTVLLAATNDHLVLDRAGRLVYTPEPKSYVYRPSVDAFFHSVVQHWHGDVVGVLLTGMGRDGALGLKALRNKGCYTLAQDEATSAVYGMPKAAAALNAAVDVLPLPRIGPRLVELCCPR